MVIEPIRKSHLPRCAKLFAMVFRRAPWSEVWTVAAASERLQDCFRTPNFFGIVALDKTNPIGFALGFIERYQHREHFVLKEMCVHPNFQREGVGSAIMKHLVMRLRAEGVQRISLFTGRGTPAEAFYERHGFRVSPKIIMMTRRVGRTNRRVR